MIEPEHEGKEREPLRSLLTERQEHIFLDWMEANLIDEKSIRYEDDLKFGVRIWGEQKETDECWEIDFVYVNEIVGGEE